MMAAGTLAQWAAIASVAGGVFVWGGGISQEVAEATKAREAAATLPVQIATLTERLAGVQRDMGELKVQQAEILSELRRLSDTTTRQEARDNRASDIQRTH